MPTNSYWENKLIRDPLYGFVGLTSNENDVLNTSVLQRLSRIKQLSHTYVVYPSAVHTRLEHVLGASHVAGRICDELSLPKKSKELVRMTALVHDVGHGPYSHLFEGIMRYANKDENFDHESITTLMLEHEPSLKAAVGPLAKDIIALLEEDSIESEIISSSLDADKMDYLRRDSYHTGVAYGVFDLERVIRTVSSVHESGRDYLAIQEKGEDALESYRLARYSMHTQVYEHHARLVADDMFVRAVKLAIDDGTISKDYFDASQPETFVRKYPELDDASIEHVIMTGGSQTAKKLIEDIRARRLLKRAYVLPLTKEGIPNPIKREKLISMNRNAIEKREAKIAREAGLEPHQVIVHLQSIKIKLYEHFEQSIGKKEKPILIKKRNGGVSSLDEDSPISASLTPIRRLFVFAPKAQTGRVKAIAENVFEAKSVY